MHPRKELYNAISKQLKHATYFEWIDLYKGQMSNKETYPTGFPCAFISINNIQYQNMTMGMNEGRVTVDVYLFFNQGGDTFEGASDQKETLEILDTITLVTNTLQFVQGECFSELEESAEEDLTERYQRPAYKISFSTLIYNLNPSKGYVPN